MRGYLGGSRAQPQWGFGQLNPHPQTSLSFLIHKMGITIRGLSSSQAEQGRALGWVLSSQCDTCSQWVTVKASTKSETQCPGKRPPMWQIEALPTALLPRLLQSLGGCCRLRLCLQLFTHQRTLDPLASQPGAVFAKQHLWGLGRQALGQL